MKSSTDVVCRSGTAPEVEKLLIISHVIHYQWNDQLFAYGPYAREVDIWADLFPHVIIASPYRKEPPPGDATAFTRQNISIVPVKETGGEQFKAKLVQFLSLPALVYQLIRAMRLAEAIHVRCPGNLGLLGVLLAPLFTRYLVAKYAGQWIGYPREPRSYRVQRTLLASRWWRGPVTVYGRWPSQPPHVIPFFTSILTDDQINRARAASRRRGFHHPLRVLYVGRLSAKKNVDKLLSAIALLQSERLAFECTVVGDGPQRHALESLAEEIGLGESIRFPGAVEFERVLDFYEWADILVLASESEGWPKAIAEGMAFGLICIGSNRGLVPQMLGDGRGLLVPPGDVAALANALRQIATAPDNFQEMRARAAAWGQQYSLENLRDALHNLLVAHWGIRLDPSFQLSGPQMGTISTR